MTRLRNVLAVIAAALFIVHAVPSFAATTPPKKGGILRYGMVSEVSSLDPHVYVGSSWKVLNMAFYNSLLSFDRHGKLAPGLAESWDVPNARTYIFHLRRGVKFHKGQLFTAKDVKYSIDRILNPATGATLRSNLLGAKVEILDNYTVKITKPEPDATLLDVLAMPEAAIVSADWMATSPNIKVEEDGTGPFILAGYEPGVKAVAKRNPNYFEKGEPYLDGVDFRMIKDADARVNALRTGALDMIEFVPWKDIDLLARQPGIKVQSAGGAFMNLWVNTSKKPFSDPRVRRAIAFAIDRNAVSKGAFFGHGTPLFGPPTSPNSPYFQKDLAHYFSYDPGKAKRLLAEAGYPNGFTASLVVYNGLDIYKTTAQIVQANLQQVGIKTNIRLSEWANVVEAKNKGDYDLMVYGVNIKLPDPDVYAYYFGADSTYWAKPIGFSDKEIESLLKRGRETIDVAKRKQIYAKLQKRVLELSPWIFINWRDQAQAYKSYVKGYVQLGGALSESSPGIVMPTLWMSK